MTLEEFDLGKVLGEGTFAEVRLATAKKGNSEVAVKILFDNANVEAFENEIACMKLTTHENSIKLLGSAIGVTYNKKKLSYLILELATHGELFQILAMTGAFDEDIARLFATQLYEVVRYFHSRGVTHRDLKPENILLDSQCAIKVADFGLATQMTDEKMTDLVGSPGYIAPEVYAGSYHHENDIWAACVIHFIMMTGCPPFRRAEDGDWWFNKLKAKKWDRWWKAHKKNSGVTLSDSVKDLFQLIFEVNPADRPSVDVILDHEWFEGDTCKQEDLMERFNGRMASDDYTDYAEEDVSEDLGEDVTHRAAGDRDDDDSDEPPFMRPFALPKKKKDDEKDDGVVGSSSTEVVNRGGDEGDEKKETAEVYKETLTCYTKFKSKSSPSDLYNAIESLIGDITTSYKNSGTYALTGTVTGERPLVFKLQVFRETENGSISVCAVRRLKGEIQDYMSAYAKITGGVRPLIIKNTTQS